jgi:hypothetical protein
MIKKFQEDLNNYSIILRKYALEDKESFLERFSQIDLEFLIIAWENSFEQIQNREIIKDASDLEAGSVMEIHNKLLRFSTEINEIFYYLNDQKNIIPLNLRDENIERGFRNILAKKHNKELEQKILLGNKVISANFEISIEKSLIELNDVFEVIFVINHGNAENFVAPELKGFEIISGPKRSTLGRFEKGISSNFISYEYKLKPRISGHIQIESASIDIQGFKFRTEVKSIEVINASAVRRGEIWKSVKLWGKIAIIPIFFILLIFGSRIRDGFTGVNNLTERIYERNLYTFNGSKCRDGTTSQSQGRGTCSWHNGVQYKFYKGQPKKSRQQCRIEGKELSWVE